MKALGTSLLIIPELRVLVLTKRHVGSGNEIDIVNLGCILHYMYMCTTCIPPAITLEFGFSCWTVWIIAIHNQLHWWSSKA